MVGDVYVSLVVIDGIGLSIGIVRMFLTVVDQIPSQNHLQVFRLLDSQSKLFIIVALTTTDDSSSNLFWVGFEINEFELEIVHHVLLERNLPDLVEVPKHNGSRSYQEAAVILLFIKSVREVF